MLTPQDTTVASQSGNEAVAQGDMFYTDMDDGEDSTDDSESSVEDYELTSEQDSCGH